MDELERFHKTRRGYITFGVGELLLAYLFASLAIDTASMFAYAAAFILIIGGAINLAKALSYTSGQKSTVTIGKQAKNAKKTRDTSESSAATTRTRSSKTKATPKKKSAKTTAAKAKKKGPSGRAKK